MPKVGQGGGRVRVYRGIGLVPDRRRVPDSEVGVLGIVSAVDSPGDAGTGGTGVGTGARMEYP